MRNLPPPSDESVGRPAAGRGRNQLYFYPGTRQAIGHLIAWGCDGTSGEYVNTSEAAAFLDLLDSAATIAGTGEPRAPTLSRPYYASELSCPAKLRAGNEIPRLPHGYRVGEVAMGFVVDTAGRVEKGSLRFMSDMDREAAIVVGSAVNRWMFDPPEWDGTPVRQFVQIAINLDTIPWRGGGGDAPRPLGVHATEDGWVRIDVGGNGAARLHEWYTPDSVDSWVARIAVASKSMRDPSPIDPLELGREPAIVIRASIDSGAKDGVRFNLFQMCPRRVSANAGMVSLDSFVVAARTARERRASPGDLPTGALERDQVACPATLMWPRVTSSGKSGVRYPGGAYPSSMARTNARVDVLVSFVVDTLGRADPRTIKVLPGTDPRALPAIEPSVAILRFTPASRAGQRVSQHVIHTIRFEPPPLCRDPSLGPYCPRRYSER